jgi:hypothetical protein
VPAVEVRMSIVANPPPAATGQGTRRFSPIETAFFVRPQGAMRRVGDATKCHASAFKGKRLQKIPRNN